MGKLPQYRVYLLRCWKEHSQKEKSRSSWRFVLEEATTRQRHGFSDLSSLTAFLRNDIEGEDDPPEHDLDEP